MKQKVNVDKISAKFEISNDMINLYGSSLGQDYLENKINKHLAADIANEIMKMYADKIKIVQNIEKGSVTYVCDIYLCNPQEIDIK